VKIGSAFPSLLAKGRLPIKPTYPLLTVLNLLRMNDIAAVPLFEGPTDRRAVSGFSCLPMIMKMSKKAFQSFLEGPCERGSTELDSFGLDDDLESLLETFKKRRLGISLVSGPVDGELCVSLLSLNDLLSLYQTKQFSSDLVVEDVASPIFSLPGRTTVRKALATMLRLSHRTVFISGDRKYISDRTIIDRIFDPSFLDPFHDGPLKRAFDTQIGSLIKTAPIEVGARTSLKAAALQVRSKWVTSLTIRSREEVVTPWDLIMKPWQGGNLTIRPRP